jgi:hypothetical protein
MAYGQQADLGQIQPPMSQPPPGVPSARRFGGVIPDLRPGEGVVLLARRHPMTILRAVMVPLVLLIMWAPGLLLALSFSDSLRSDPLLNPGGPPAWASTAVLIVYLGLGTVLVAWLIYAAANWRSDWVALTTRRVIVMEKTLFIREARREAPLLKVQNVLADYPNGVAIAFDYGDLSVDTSGTGTLAFRSVPRPRAFRDAIFGQQNLLQAHEPPPEDRRAAAVLGIVQGRDPALSQPRRNPSSPPAVTGYGALSQFLPLAPMRTGQKVTWHKHWWYLVRGLAMPLLVWVLVVGGWLAAAALADPLVFGAATAAIGWAAVAMTPVCFAWAIWIWEDWRNDTYRIDGERLSHVESLPFGLREQSKETVIARVSDVMYVVPGPLANLLDFGNVVIKTPGEATEFVFAGVPCPREVQQEIMDKVDEHRRAASAGTDREIAAWLRTYHDVTRDPQQP